MDVMGLVRVGDKIKMDGEKQRYTVQGVRGHFVIATKPFNAKKTYLYTLIDTKENIRGPLNSVFGIFNDVDSPSGATELFDWIEADGGWETWHVSHRKHKALTEAEIAQITARPDANHDDAIERDALEARDWLARWRE